MLGMTLKVAIASDHGGFALKAFLQTQFKDVAVEWVDLGPATSESVDYPDYGSKLAAYIAAGKADFGVALCGSGIGISIAANRNPAIRCALCHDETTARLAREHNDANIMALGARLIGEDLAIACLTVFLTTPFSQGERHIRRVQKLSSC